MAGGLPRKGTWVRTEDGRVGRVRYVNVFEGNVEIAEGGDWERTFAVEFGVKLYRVGRLVTTKRGGTK